MLLLFLFFPRGVFIQFFFHGQSRVCGEADHSAEVFGSDLRLHAPPLFLGVLILIQQCPRGSQSGHGGTGGLVWRGGDPRPVPLIPAVAGLSAVGTLLDEDEDAEEKRRRIEAKIAAENFGAVVGFAAGAALAVKAKLDEHAAQEEQKENRYEQMMGGLG